VQEWNWQKAKALDNHDCVIKLGRGNLKIAFGVRFRFKTKLKAKKRLQRLHN
jgi:hypothetical protein